MSHQVPAALRHVSRHAQSSKLPKPYRMRPIPRRKEPEQVSEPAELSRAEAIQLLGQFLSMAPPRWQNLQSFVNVYITVDLTVLGATLIGLSKFSSWPKNVILLLAPISAIVIAQLAKETVRRQEQHIRELIVATAHLEQLIGLYDAKPAASSLWPGDSHILPQHWIDSRLKHETSDEFINDPVPGGTVKASMRMFSWLQIVAVIVGVAVVAFPFM
jgi:hypothetical protein